MDERLGLKKAYFFVLKMYVGYPRDAPATVLFGEWFRFVKPSDQQFFFEKTKHTSNFLAFEASLMSIRDNKVLEVEFKFDSICCSLSITTASSNPSAVVPKLPLFYTPSKPFIPAAKTQDPINNGEKLEQHKSKDNNVKGNPNNKDENDYLYSYEERLEQHIK
ncbi:hypothetical protein LXL04_003813 [Taraxacum kok-saghyz]